MRTCNNHSKIKLYPFKNLGKANHGWLDTNYHFSFSSYYNPARMGFGALRVINDDLIRAGSGFPPHAHSDMEIITYVRSGEVMHQDSLGNNGSTMAGDVQVMSAGTGIKHSEFASKSDDTLLFQIWIEPNVLGVKPCWATKTFPKEFVKDELQLLVSGRERDKGKDALPIYQDAAIYGGKIKAGGEINIKVSDMAYIVSSTGRFTANGTEINERDGAEVTDESELKIKALEDSELLVIDVGH